MIVNDPIADTVRGILDGHIILSRSIASQGLYPCIDVPASLSRVMKDVTSSDHQQQAIRLRRFISDYREAEDLINIGAYVAGSNPDIDIAVQKRDAVRAFLSQRISDPVDYNNTLEQLTEIVR